MAISVNWATQVIFVPKADLVLISGTQYSWDVDAFRLELKALEASEEGMPFVDTHRHITQYTIAGFTYARAVEIINGYTVEFEDGQYTVISSGANHNTADVKVENQVSLVTQNSAGLVVVEATVSADDIAESVLIRGSYMKRDNISYDSNGFPISGRERLFPTKALADAATYGGVGEGETDTYTIAATPEGTFPNSPRTFDRIRDA